MKEYDVVIIGCGPAGLSAAIFTGRANLRVAVIGFPEKSQMSLAMNIENYFGFPEGIDGPILLNKGVIQAQKFGCDIIKEEVVSAERIEEGNKVSFSVKTNKGNVFRSNALIVATGIPIRKSGIENEERLVGKGVHYCVNCDGPFYRGKRLAIIGNGDHAVEAALEALSFTRDIIILANANEFNFSPESDKELTKFQIKTELGKIREFKGEKWFESIIFEDGREMKVDGVFMACGIAGALDFASNLGLEIRNNLLVTDESGMTSMQGVFAAGNCTATCRQIAKNVGDGCNAAISVIKYLRSRENYIDYVHGSREEKKTDVKQTISNQLPLEKKKLRVGWFSFSCCEDSTIIFTEMLNDYYDKWKDIIDFAHIRVLKGKNDMSNLDVAFVEGAISNEKMLEEVKKIRANCKKLVAIGSCACTGMPSGQRNDFDENRKREIDPIIKAYSNLERVLPLSEVVKVDYSVQGCPMTEQAFLSVLNQILKEFGIDAQL